MKISSKNYTPEIREQLMQQVQMQMSEKRFRHVLGVEEMAIALAKKYGCCPNKASIAALAHDYAKERSDDAFIYMIEKLHMDVDLLNWDNAIWHGIVGAEFVRQELGIEEEDILQAIRLHTTGAVQMSLLDQIIYVADYIEPNRAFPGVEEARKLALIDLALAVAYETQHTLQFLLKKELPIYPKTLETYNKWVAKK